jgi:uncharacterized protein YbjT (DUF2867 family)
VLVVIVVTAAGGPTGTAVVRELRARGLPVRAVVHRRNGQSLVDVRDAAAAAGLEALAAPRLAELIGPPRSFAEHLAHLPLRDAA